MVNNSTHGHPNPFVNMRGDLPWPPPTTGPDSAHTRAIPFRVWELVDIQTIAQRFLDGDTSLIYAVTSDCIEDMQREKLALENVAELLLLLEVDDYVNSQWCMTSARPGVRARPELRWLPCDAYCLPLEEEDENGEVDDKKYYIKVCRTASGAMLLVVSMHPSNY